MKEETTSFVEIISHCPACASCSMGITLRNEKADFVSRLEEYGLVSVICEREGLVSAGFKVGRTGFR